MVFIVESIYSLCEYGKQTVFFICFLSLSLSGICVVDSAIYSVGKKAQDELRIDGNNTIRIYYRTPPTIQEAKSKLTGVNRELLFEKNSSLKTNSTVVADFPQGYTPVIGVESSSSLVRSLGLSDSFRGNVVIYKGDCSVTLPEFIQINHIPFRIVGCKSFAVTSFLDSLGLGEVKSDTVFIPLNTAMRLELDTRVNNATVKFNREVTTEDVEHYKKFVNDNFKSGGDISSFLNAKMSVDNVINKFSLLSNFIYIFLLISSVAIIVIMCRKMFDERRTEFALKIIHGISIKAITIQVCTEMFIKSVASLILSVFMSFIILQFLVHYINVNLLVRFEIVMFVYIIVFIAGFLTSVYCGRGFYKLNPVVLIRGRLC